MSVQRATRDWRTVLHRLDEVRWELPTDFNPAMRVPGRIYANDALMDILASDASVEQVANVAALPGIVGQALAMPDIHQGYGFPIGGVAATRYDGGVVSPGGVGFDINCGVRLLRTPLHERDLHRKLDRLLQQMARDIPAGAGRNTTPLSADDAEGVLQRGAAWLVERMGYGFPDDLAVIESNGCLDTARPALLSKRARARGLPQIGTLGSGNHFAEVQVVAEVLDADAARAFGIAELGQVCVMIHTGSRGLGHQVCQDFLDIMQDAMANHGISVPDPQLACVPARSTVGEEYLGAMAAAANFAWANRQAIATVVRRAFKSVAAIPEREVELVYDVSHNMVKIERHTVDGIEQELCVHRKGATRAFPAGHPELPEAYRAAGQPVLVPGDMGRASYVCVGEPEAMRETFGSSCHGAGRVLSRNAAKRELAGVDIAARMAGEGIVVKTPNRAGLAEEASEAYKDVRQVVATLQTAGVARPVVRLRPLGVVKG